MFSLCCLPKHSSISYLSGLSLDSKRNLCLCQKSQNLTQFSLTLNYYHTLHIVSSPVFSYLFHSFLCDYINISESPLFFTGTQTQIQYMSMFLILMTLFFSFNILHLHILTEEFHPLLLHLFCTLPLLL